MERQLFTQDWKFRRAGETEVKTVCLPHDAMLEEQRDPSCGSGSACAFFPGGTYFYEKKFEAPARWEQKHVLFAFEGVYQKSTVRINGKEAGGCVYGYAPFTVCADAFLQYGQENVISVEVDNSQVPNSRWYTGSGIYRPVWLYVGEQIYIEYEGVKIRTVSVNPPQIEVRTAHHGGDKVLVEILEEEGNPGQSGEPERTGTLQSNGNSCQGTVLARAQGEDALLDLPGAVLWSERQPKLYTCRVSLYENGAFMDAVTEKFGIRQITWSAEGFFVNGEETLLRGGCIHHDNGILGAAAYDESEWRRAKILKKAGYNAIRSSHNPTSRAMLEACDALGLYVMDETWDVWYSHKSKYDYASDFMEHYRQDLSSMVNRDYNHPSVIFYSIGNEVSEPASEKGVALAKEMTEYLHSLDETRAVTAGINLMIITRSAKGNGIYKEEGGRDDSQEAGMSKMNSTMFNMITSMVGSSMNKSANGKKADQVTAPVLDTLDIAGYNYASGRYPLEGKAHPDRVIFGSETFPQDICKNWKMVRQYPYLIGDFMWTAWDYLGEVGIGAWAYTADGKGFSKPYPWLLADVGAIDILGNPNGELFWAQAAWDLSDRPQIAVRPVNHPGVNPAKGSWRGTNAIPGWSWKDCEGNKAVVEVFMNAESVELSLNGKKVGRKKLKDCRAVFQLKYVPGILEAVAYNSAGAECGRSTQVSAKEPFGLHMKPEKETASCHEVVYVPVTVADQDGVTERNADCTVTVSVEGGELLGFGSASPRTEESYRTGIFTTYYGDALAVVRAGHAGKMRVTARAGKMEAEAVIRIED